MFDEKLKEKFRNMKLTNGLNAMIKEVKQKKHDINMELETMFATGRGIDGYYSILQRRNDLVAFEECIESVKNKLNTE